MSDHKTATLGDAGRWYTREGECVAEVPYADPSKGMRPPTLRDARKHGWLPSVTTIIKEMAKPGLDRWIQRQVLESAATFPRGDMTDAEFIDAIMAESGEIARRTAERGTYLHAEIGKGWGGDGKHSDPAVVGAWEAMAPVVGWETPVQWEVPFADVEDYAGTADMVWVGEKLCVADIKTTNIDSYKKPRDEWAMQMAAYRGRFQWLTINQSVECYQFVIDRDSGETVIHEWTQAELDRGWRMFEACLELWKAKHNM